MRNASSHQSKSQRQRKKKACNQEVSRCNRVKRQQRNVRKSVLHLKSCFLLIRPIDFFLPFSMPSPFSTHDFIFCLGKL